MRVVDSFKRTVDQVFTNPLLLGEVKEVMFQELQFFSDIAYDINLANGKQLLACDRLFQGFLHVKNLSRQFLWNSSLSNSLTLMQIALILFAIQRRDFSLVVREKLNKQFVMAIVWLYMPTHFLFQQVEQPKYSKLISFSHLLNVCAPKGMQGKLDLYRSFCTFAL